MGDVWMLDGGLEPITFDDFAEDRSPLELTQRVISTFSAEGDWVLDPFAGFGTTLSVAQALGRHAVGFEQNPKRALFAGEGLVPPNRIVNAPIQSMLDDGGYDRFDLLFTSPPYPMVNLKDDPWGPSYFGDMAQIFFGLRGFMKPGSAVVVEVSNVKTEEGFRPLIAEFGACLRAGLRQTNEIVRINTGPTPAGPGTHYSCLLVFEV
ncbi:hypothetical protein GCM10007989_09620 [Devosia pacifica]|uniref:Methyltransferase n=1 Tax=Devosia pacifica TaxID=1335967 RepID=A0A918RZ25_9HYPH|nr:DNA methyltransferase [Devosia pacifica]GHA16630.1 hypothetical protein GCM10007989_09620 [Devosia pacifica]